MEILELCEKIGLQPEVKKRVEEISKEFDFGAVEEILKDLHDYDKMKEAWMRLEEKIGEDSEHMKILTCMLKASADACEIYQKKGIEDSIYFATMKCYTRFLEEAYERIGRYVFDRYWWTGRRAAICFGSESWSMKSSAQTERARKADQVFPSIYLRMRTFHRPVWMSLWLRQNTFLQNMIQR